MHLFEFYPRASYQSPKLVGKTDACTEGQGLFARERIEKDELLVTWGGETMGRVGFDALPPELRSISLQIAETLFLVPTRPCAADRVNHCCEPNAGMFGPISLVALRMVEPGEEIRYDYAMSDGSDYDEFECRCGTPRCRGRVTGRDWQDPSLWSRYRGRFSPYLARRIRARRSAKQRRGVGSFELAPLSAGHC